MFTIFCLGVVQTLIMSNLDEYDFPIVEKVFMADFLMIIVFIISKLMLIFEV